MNSTLDSNSDVLHPIKGCVHDIRNMLTVIEGNASLMMADEHSDDVQASIQSMEYAAQHADALCDQLVKYLSLVTQGMYPSIYQT